MSSDLTTQIFAGFLICVGLVFNIVGCIGLVRMPNVFTGLQSAAKCVTLGTCSILAATFVLFGITPAGIRAVICIAFIVLTVPAAAHALARATHRSGVSVEENAVVDKYDEEVVHPQKENEKT